MPQKDYLYKSRKGPLAISMTNDYQFRALMQMNEKVLRALVSALLHLEEEAIETIEIKNPIELGTYIEDKDFILDLKILLNSQTVVNLEIQVINEHNWCERSMLYLCRAFDNVNRGEDYLHVLPAIQIGLLDFDLFPDRPEFYASYMMLNTKTYEPYSDKLQIRVMELRRSDDATEEDKEWKLDKWAQFFKAGTWEEIVMLTKDLPVINDAAETVYHISLDDRIREQCEAREDFYRRQRTTERLIERQKETVEKQQKQIQKQKGQIEEQQGQIKEQKGQIEEQQGQIEEQQAQLTTKDEQILAQKEQIEKMRQLLQEKGLNPEQL